MPAATVPLYWSAPFVLLLAAVALMPFVHRRFWQRHYGWVALGLGLITASYYAVGTDDAGPWVHYMQEYVSFIVPLGALYVISGGIVIHVSRKATPLANASLLLFGAVIANLFGTTGASILLIRPYLRMNRNHVRPYHVVFFIFIVSNVGGCLTPVGDPPLFLGYLAGVPFWWVLEHCWTAWAFVVALLLTVFLVLDTLAHRRQPREGEADHSGPAVGFLGFANVLFILVVVAAVFQDGLFEVTHHAYETGRPSNLLHLLWSREVLMTAAAVASRVLTGPHIYQRNEFTYAPIKEVAILFVGIFSTMVPALQWLEANANRFRVDTPGQFYFASGTLSSVLDNAPTYLTFLKLELGRLPPDEVRAATAELGRMAAGKTDEIGPDLPTSVRQAIRTYASYHPEDLQNNSVNPDRVRVAFLIAQPRHSLVLVAISLGAVFFGACTYIGNGPNFMVKSIADAAGVKTPGFIAYVVCYTLPVLIPIYVLTWLIFLRA